MTLARRLIVLCSGTAVAVSVAAFAPVHAQQPEGRDVKTLTIEKATVDWIEKAEVAPRIDGNVEAIELTVGKTVKKDGTIGFLYRQKAILTVKKAELAAKSDGAIKKAEAQVDQYLSAVARNVRLTSKDPRLVPQEEVEKAKAELLMGYAMVKQATEEQALAKAELALAQNQLDDHEIKAPFAGVVTKWLKNPGESVSSREAVVELGNLDKLRVFAYIPYDYAGRVKVGGVVEFQRRLTGFSAASTSDMKRFRGVISFVDPQLQGVGEDSVRIYADFANESHELRPGEKGALTIFLGTPGVAAGAAVEDPAAARVGADAPVQIPAPAPAVNNAELPPLPR